MNYKHLIRLMWEYINIYKYKRTLVTMVAKNVFGCRVGN